MSHAKKNKVASSKPRPTRLPPARRQQREKLEEAAARAVERALAMGAQHCEAAAGQGQQLELSVRNGEIELLKEARSSGLSMRVICEGRVACSSTNDLSAEAVDGFVSRLIEMAEISEEDSWALPPDPGELWKGEANTDEDPLELFDRGSTRVTADRAKVLAKRAERAAFAADSRITASEGASFARSLSSSVLVTSGGFVGSSAGTHQHLAVQVVADDEGGKKRNGVHWTGSRRFSELEAPAVVGREAARRAVASLGAAPMPTGRYPIVFDREAAAALVSLISSCVLGQAIYRQQSFLADRLGEQIASSKVSIVDDPTLLGAPGSRRFDGEGRRTKPIRIIHRGRLESFLLDSYSARRLHLDPTGSAANGGGIPYASTSNFRLKPGRGAPEKLLKGIKDGLFVTGMMGFGFDALTGSFSRGASGFRIRNGALAEPVSEITVSRNLGELLGGIEQVASDIDERRATSSPSLRVDFMTVSGS